MTIELTRNMTFMARGDGPVRPIIVEAETRVEAWRGWLDLYKQQVEETDNG